MVDQDKYTRPKRYYPRSPKYGLPRQHQRHSDDHGVADKAIWTGGNLLTGWIPWYNTNKAESYEKVDTTDEQALSNCNTQRAA